jgi:tetratricopeptide (TPR) repeat protein
VKRAFDAGDAKPMQDWYGAIRLIFAPGLLNEAETLVKDVSGGDPTPVGWDYLSFLALGNDSGGPAKVIAYLEPVAERDYSKMPEFASILYDRLGTSYYLAGQCEKAVQTFQRALQYSPNNHAVLNNYAYLCVECLKDADRAIEPARLAVQIQPTRAEYLDTLAFVLITAKKYEEGLDYADRAAKLGDSAPVQLHRAMALFELGRIDQAKDAARRAGEMNPDPPTKASLEQLLARMK